LGKAKPWPVEDERKLEDCFTSCAKDLGVLAVSFDVEYTEETIWQN
jgi:hypothetical protein